MKEIILKTGIKKPKVDLDKEESTHDLHFNMDRKGFKPSIDKCAKVKIPDVPKYELNKPYVNKSYMCNLFILKYIIFTSN